MISAAHPRQTTTNAVERDEAVAARRVGACDPRQIGADGASVDVETVPEFSEHRTGECASAPGPRTTTGAIPIEAAIDLEARSFVGCMSPSRSSRVGETTTNGSSRSGARICRATASPSSPAATSISCVRRDGPRRQAASRKSVPTTPGAIGTHGSTNASALQRSRSTQAHDEQPS